MQRKKVDTRFVDFLGAMNFIFIFTYLFILACAESVVHSTAIAEKSLLPVERTSNAEQIELSSCLRGKGKWQRSSDRHD